MNAIKNIVLLLAFLVLAGTSYAKDTVTSHILIDFNKSKYKSIKPAGVIPPGKIVKLWGWLKLVSESTIKPETYYLEWVYRDEGNVENLGNYNTNRKYLEYKRKLDREEAYYWVSKRVWSQGKGEYIFRVYIKSEGNYKIVSESIVKVGE